MEKSMLMYAIASEDYRKYIVENGIILSDWEMATLIYNNTQMYIDERMKALQLLEKETSEEKLRVQINACISRMRNFLSGFRENDGNSYYQLKMWYEVRIFYMTSILIMNRHILRVWQKEDTIESIKICLPGRRKVTGLMCLE